MTFIHMESLACGIRAITVGKASQRPLRQQGTQKGLDIEAKRSNTPNLAQYCNKRWNLTSSPRPECHGTVSAHCNLCLSGSSNSLASASQ
ncbi:putative uncharacterized protein CCDC28A-AS1, partial [Plecturocebus cupreus]